jgi:hypothetical protein
VADLYDHFHIDTHHLGSFTNLKQMGLVEEFIDAFEKLAFIMEGMTYVFFKELFISGFMDEIHAHVLMAAPRLGLKILKGPRKHNKKSHLKPQKTPFIPHPKPTLPTPPSNPLKLQKLNWDKMVELQLKGICYNFDDKYFPGNKCKGHNIFMAMIKDFFKEEVYVSHVPELPPN